MSDRDRRQDLWFALRTRALTDGEAVEAESYGKSLNIVPGASYRIGEPERVLADGWAAQGVLRAAAMNAQKHSPYGCICPPTSEQTCQSPLCPRKPAPPI